MRGGSDYKPLNMFRTSQLTFLFYEASGHVLCFLSSKTDYVSIGRPLHGSWLHHCTVYDTVTGTLATLAPHNGGLINISRLKVGNYSVYYVFLQKCACARSGWGWFDTRILRTSSSSSSLSLFLHCSESRKIWHRTELIRHNCIYGHCDICPMCDTVEPRLTDIAI